MSASHNCSNSNLGCLKQKAGVPLNTTGLLWRTDYVIDDMHLRSVFETTITRLVNLIHWQVDHVSSYVPERICIAESDSVSTLNVGRHVGDAFASRWGYLLGDDWNRCLGKDGRGRKSKY